MPAINGALAFKLHTGWAALVVVTGEPGNIKVLLSRRLELLPPDGSIPRFIYHRAAELRLSEASLLVKSAEKAAQETAQIALIRTLRSFNPAEVVIKAAGVLRGSTSVPGDLSAVLASHALIHAAEGHLFRQAVVAACASCGVDAMAILERDLWRQVASAYSLEESSLRHRVDALRGSVGPPWGADQKAATAAGLLVLRAGNKA